ncbi:hypothetical protein HXX02_17230 [Microbulbifer elongatus]|uniref:Uncharacterized protein n=1 Tax=Microbulbifer elongatus TaxID=86173 RepID=A0ABT1P506_9GAMM|nr:hypothetical protein [Microbulbifer elongatus]MCQ3831177.1 hypothetical protein [Microbulbifer elongatus]
MEEISEIVTSPAWWITVVIAGIAINLVSGYLKELIDSKLSRISHWWEARTKEQQVKRDNYISRLKTDDKFFALHTIRHTKSRSWAIMWSLLGVMLFLGAQIFADDGKASAPLMAIGAIAFFRSFKHLMSAAKFLHYAEQAIDPQDT